MTKKILAVTGCPTGIAHTFLAAKSLTVALENEGYTVKIETHGAAGVENELTAEEIAEADGIIVACDKKVDLDRFAGKKVVVTSVKYAIRSPKGLIAEVLDPALPLFKAGGSGSQTSSGLKTSQGSSIYISLMNGVSYMIPFVITGGLFIAISLAFGGKPLPGGLTIPEGSPWQKVLDIGVVAFTLMIPILSGYIAFAIGDRPALPAGMIGGWIANNGSFYGASAGTGFIGAIISGFIVGYFVKWLKSLKWPSVIEPLAPLMFIPMLSSLLIGFIFIYGIGAPIAGMMRSMTALLMSLSTGNIVLLGLVMGLMQGFDMGGPFGKVVLLFNIGLLAEGRTEFMGAQAAAIPVAPLGMSLAVFLGKKWGIFENSEIETAKASFAMGLVGISEGAIPFAVKDPLAVIPANMIGSAVACILSFLLNVKCQVAHGGPIVVLLGTMTPALLALFCMTAGSCATAFVAVGLKLRKRSAAKPQMA